MISLRREFFRSVLVLGLALSMISCASIAISHHQLGILNKGMSLAEIEQKLKPGPINTVRSIEQGRSFTFQSYRLLHGDVGSWYLLAFEADKLIYWGEIHEFRRQSDVALSNAINKAYPELAQLKR
jgi:hypothetical protein